MMKNCVFLFFLLPLVSFAQSKKKIYQQLKIESEIQARKNDSLENEIEFETKKIKNLNLILLSLNEDITKAKNYAILKQEEFFNKIADFNLLIETYHPKGLELLNNQVQELIPETKIIYKGVEIPNSPIKPFLANLDRYEKLNEKNGVIKNYISALTT